MVVVKGGSSKVTWRWVAVPLFAVGLFDCTLERVASPVGIANLDVADPVVGYCFLLGNLVGRCGARLLAVGLPLPAGLRDESPLRIPLN